MKLTSSKIKNIMIIVSIVLPFLFFQVGVYYNYNTVDKNIIMEESYDELQLIGKRSHQKLEEESLEVAAVHNALFINQMDFEALETNDSYGQVTYLWSQEDDLSDEDRTLLNGFLKTRQAGNGYAASGGSLYVYHVSTLHNAVLAKKIPFKDFVDQILMDDQDHYRLCIYYDKECIYAINASGVTIPISTDENIQVDDKVIKYHYVVNDRLEAMVEKDLSPQFAQIRNQIILYTILIELLLIGIAIAFFRKHRQSRSEVEIMASELKQMNRSLKRQTLMGQALQEDVASLPTPVYQKIVRYRNSIEEMIQEREALTLAIKETESNYQKYEVISANHRVVIDQLLGEKDNLTAFMSSYLSMIDQVLIEVDLKGNIKSANAYFYHRFRYNEGDQINLLDIIQFETNIDNVFHHFLTTNEESVFAYLQYHEAEDNKRELLRLRKIKWTDDDFLLIGKSIHDEVTLQSLIMRKNREFDYINQINGALISNWGVDDLLKSIIKKVDFLFSANISEIFVKEKDKWLLKESTQRAVDQKIHIEDINDYFATNIEVDSQIKVLKECDQYIKEIGLEEKVQHVILAPLEVDNDILALMVIGVEKLVSTSDINMIKMFKNQASIVVQRSMLYDELREQYFNTIEALVNVIEAKDKYTEGHSRRVSQFSVVIAEKMGYSNEEIEKIEISGLLHDVGKVGIKQEILTKRGKLTDEEYEAIKEHPRKGVQILKAIKLDNEIIQGILYHHVRVDLKGYPADHGLTELPEVAAIIGVADAFDAMTSARSYSVAKDIDRALEELIRYKGTQFKADIVEAMSEIVRDTREELETIINDMRG